MTRVTRMLTILVVCLALSPTIWADSRGNLNFVFAGRAYEDNDTWDPVDTQFAWGVDFDFGLPHWPVNWAFQFNGASQDKNIAVGSVLVPYELQVLEFSTGVVKYWGKVTRPYIGGGISLVNVDTTSLVTAPGTSVDDTTIGGYVDLGIIWRIGKLFNIGVDIRGMYADVELNTNDTSATYGQAGLVLGWGW
ncbi:MAG: hypothetical protein PVF68_02940 [Acidobacteriota bacterium]